VLAWFIARMYLSEWSYSLRRKPSILACGTQWRGVVLSSKHKHAQGESGGRGELRVGQSAARGNRTALLVRRRQCGGREHVNTHISLELGQVVFILVRHPGGVHHLRGDTLADI